MHVCSYVLLLCDWILENLPFIYVQEIHKIIIASLLKFFAKNQFICYECMATSNYQNNYGYNICWLVDKSYTAAKLLFHSCMVDAKIWSHSYIYAVLAG